MRDLGGLLETKSFLLQLGKLRPRGMGRDLVKVTRLDSSRSRSEEESWGGGGTPLLWSYSKVRDVICQEDLSIGWEDVLIFRDSAQLGDSI